MLVGVQAINALRNIVLHRLLWLSKKRWKQRWPGQDKDFWNVQAKFVWPQQKSSSTRFESPKPCKCFIPGVGLHHHHLPLLCAYLCATGAPYSIAGWRERISGDQAHFKSSSPLPCYLAWQEQPATTVVFLQREGTACKWLLQTGGGQAWSCSRGCRAQAPLSLTALVSTSNCPQQPAALGQGLPCSESVLKVAL